MEFHEICERLDALCLSVLDLMQQILEERQKLDDLLQGGFVDMAKSRYLMGSTSVSMLQVKESDITPLKTVMLQKDINDNIEFSSFKLLEFDSSKPVKTQSDTVRHRGHKGTADELVEGLSGIELSESKSIAKSKSNDPLKWFGVLVPQSLKSSQKSFQKAISVLAGIASLQSQLIATHKELNELQLKKSELVEHLNNNNSCT